MSQVLEKLLDLLRLERIEQNLFRGQSQDLGWGTVFGGQVLGQALSAAEQTVSLVGSMAGSPAGSGERDGGPRLVHSLHGYFLRTGDASLPIVYDVDCIRDGKSFTTRRVVAIQNGRAIFNLAASFQRIEDGFEHQDAMPEVAGPDDLLSEQQLAKSMLDQLPEAVRMRLSAETPIEIRPVNPYNPLAPDVRPAERFVWYRANGTLPDTPSVHQHLLAYASDFNLLGTAMQPHGASWLTPGMQVASLDHAMWFHRPFRLDDWVLYAIDSPSASGARGLSRGRFFARDGTLIASTMQEGLIRRW